MAFPFGEHAPLLRSQEGNMHSISATCGFAALRAVPAPTCRRLSRACSRRPPRLGIQDEIRAATNERRPFRIDKSTLSQDERRLLRLRSKAIPLVVDHLPLDVLFEDDHFLVLNKPPYIKMHPSHRFEGGSLLNRAIGYLGYPPRILHRLDMHTTGVVIMAKVKEVCHPIMQQFMKGNVSKHYLCISDAVYNGQSELPDSFCVNKPIQRSSIQFLREIGDSNPDSKAAVTDYKLLDQSRSKQMVLLQASPRTGRTHQIRVHSASKSLPIIGDDLYNPIENGMYGDYDQISAAAKDPTLARYGANNPLRKSLKLHAWKIGLMNPISNEPMQFSAPLPSHMQNLLEWCEMCLPS